MIRLIDYLLPRNRGYTVSKWPSIENYIKETSHYNPPCNWLMFEKYL